MAKDPRFTRKTASEERREEPISGKEIYNNTILTDHIANGSITPEKISENWPVFSGYFGAEISPRTNFNPYLYSDTNIGFTLNSNTSRLTIQASGYYFVSAQQLVNTAGQVAYLCIRKEGSIIVHAYSNNDETYDLNACAVIYCNVGQYIDFYYLYTVTYSWTGAHSRVSCFLIR